MLILLPPSEGKAAPRRGKPLDLSSLSFPSLHEARAEVLDAVVVLCSDRTADAPAVLGLGPTQGDEVDRNAHLSTAPTARADHVYTGVLYEALDLPGLDAAARRRASSRVAIISGLFGLLRPADRIPAYRLSGSVTLPGVGPVARHWARNLSPAFREAAGDGLVVDLRSGTYAPFWKPAASEAARVVTVRVLQEVDGRRKAVSHFNKATKGRLVRDLLLDGSSPRSAQRFAELLADLGWKVEDGERPDVLDVVVSDL